MRNEAENLDDFFALQDIGKEGNPTSLLDSYFKLKEVIKQLPIKELVNRGWIEEGEGYQRWVPLLLNINSPTFSPLFRRHSSASDALSLAWLSRVAKVAEERLLLSRSVQRISKFEGLDSEVLHEIVSLSVNPENISRLPEMLANYGIVLVYERSLPAMKLDGAIYSAPTGNPVIGISFRYSRLDNFWFTLMHELGHALIHYDILNTAILDNLEEKSTDLIELEADKFALNTLIPKHLWRASTVRYDPSERTIIQFAKEQGIHPSIVAGRLQRETGNFAIARKIVDSVDTRKIVFDG